MHSISKFPAVDGQNGWLATMPFARDWPVKTVSQDEHFHTIVIGAGYCGLAAAARLAELLPNEKIGLVDALRVGQGSSGRNSGFVIDLPHFSDTRLIHSGAGKMLRGLNVSAIEQLDAIRHRQKLDVGWDRAGKYLAAHETEFLPNLDHYVDVLQQLGEPYQVFEGSELARRLGTPYYKRAVYTGGNVLINPVAMIHAIAKDLPSNVTLFEESPVRAIDYPSKSVRCDGGVLTANKLILAVDGFTEAMKGSDSRTVPFFTYAALTRPLNDAELKNFADASPWGLTSAYAAGATFRFTNDKRLLIRTAFDVLPDLSCSKQDLESGRRRLRESFDARFPQLSAVAFEHVWGGLLCSTLNRESIFAERSPGVFTVGATNGVGICKGTYTGRYVAEWAAGVESEELSFIRKHSKPTWLGPEPLKNLAARIRVGYEVRASKGDI